MKAAMAIAAALLLGGCSATQTTEAKGRAGAVVGKAKAAYRALGTFTETTDSFTVHSDGTWTSNRTIRTHYESPVLEGLKAIGGAAGKAAR